MEDQKIKLIISYGNPGKRYANSRSNIGFTILDAAVKKIPSSWVMRSRFMLFFLNANPLTVLVKPRTFENRFDDTAFNLYRFYKVVPDDFYIIYPDENLKFGQYEISKDSNVLPEPISKIEKKIQSKEWWKVRIGIMGASEELNETELSIIKHLGEKLADELNFKL